jgi:hypothetical protein
MLLKQHAMLQCNENRTREKSCTAPSSKHILLRREDAEGWRHRKIRLIEGNAKCRHLKKLTCQETFWQVFIFSEAQNPIPLPLLYTEYVYTVYFRYTYSDREGGRGEDWFREKIRGAIVHKAGSKKPKWLTLSPVYNSNKHLPQSPFTGQDFQMTTFWLGVYMFNWSRFGGGGGGRGSGKKGGNPRSGTNESRKLLADKDMSCSERRHQARKLNKFRENLY